MATKDQSINPMELTRYIPTTYAQFVTRRVGKNPCSLPNSEENPCILCYFWNLPFQNSPSIILTLTIDYIMPVGQDLSLEQGEKRCEYIYEK